MAPGFVEAGPAGMVLVYAPCFEEVTTTVILQVEFFRMVALFNFIEVLVPLTKALPSLSVKVAEPQPVRVGEVVGGLEFVKTTSLFPAVGRTSKNVTWLRELLASLLRTLMVNVLVPPTAIVLGLKLLFNEGGWTRITFSVALAGVVL